MAQESSSWGEPLPASTIYRSTLAAITGAGFSVNENVQHSYFEAPFGHEIVSYKVTVFCGDGYFTTLADLPLHIAPGKLACALAALNKMSLLVPMGGYQITDDQRVQFKLGTAARTDIDHKNVVFSFSCCVDAIQRVIPEVVTWIDATATATA